MSGNVDTYNRSGYYAFIFSMVLSVGLIIVLSFMYDGIQIDEIEDVVVEEGQGLTQKKDEGPSKDFDIAAVAEPWVYSDDMAAYGKQQVYATNCASCHGSKADGKGPAGGMLVPPPRNLIEGGWKKGGTSKELFVTLETGLPGTSMVSFKHLPVADRWALVHYIRSITKDKPADDAAALAEFGKTAN
ncbi:MAG: cytochrome c [Bdellovibrionales bacterium]